MQKNSVNKNGEEKSMSSRTTPMNLNQRTNEKMRKTNRSISNKHIQKCTMLQRNGVQMRDRPKRVTSNPKEKIVNLSEFSSRDPRIRIPLDKRPSDIRHDVVQGRRLIIRVDRMLDHWHPKSINHYRRGNSVPYTTPHKSVGIIGIDREVRIELSDQGSLRRMRNIQ